jgi:serine phosphatase RsbU (regulator of sigma subunit)
MPLLNISVAAAKVSKYATSESGDTLELIERPMGGLSLVLADGQRSGKAAKSISNIVARKAVTLLAEGVRDGAVARAAHDYLRTMRGGKVSATLNIISVDLATETIVISRNSHCPTVVWQSGQLALLDEPSKPVGIHTWTKPWIAEMPLVADTFVVAYTDGVMHAGGQGDRRVDVPALLQQWMGEEGCTAQTLADAILSQAVELDRGRPADDISVVVVCVRSATDDTDGVRRLSASVPVRVLRDG